MVNQMTRAGVQSFSRGQCTTLCGKTEAISRINISPSTLINHCKSPDTGWRPQSTYVEASKLENKIPFQLQRLNWRTEEMTGNGLPVLSVFRVFKSLVREERQKDKERCYSPGCTPTICNW